MTDMASDPQALTVLTTEHFVLQTARSGTIGEANGRAAIYLGALSSALIALGFTSDRPEAFQAFAAVVIPSLLLLGWFTFVRLVQTSAKSVLYLVRMQRIRRMYADWVPELAGMLDDVPAGRAQPAVTGAAGYEAQAALTTTGLRAPASSRRCSPRRL